MQTYSDEQFSAPTLLTSKQPMPVSQKAEASKIREYIRFEAVDFNTKGLSKTVPGRHKHGKVFLYHGAAALGSNHEVMVVPEEVLAAGCQNTELIPDWSTEQILPWACRPEKGIVVKRVYCEQVKAPLPRSICRKLVDNLKSEHGLEIFAGGELEFVLAKPGEKEPKSWEPYFDGPEIFTTLQNSKAMDFCYELEDNMEQVGVDIRTMNAEYGAGQVELTFTPKFGLEAADMTATFRTGTKEIAQQHGLRATFMAKPFGVSGVGSGGHFNFSLWRRDMAMQSDDGHAISKASAGCSSAFHDFQDPEGLSSVARKFLAGVLEHAPALEALCSPTVPCYSRHGNWAPVIANWGPENRLAAVRVKSSPKAAPEECYMELRMPSASANPYLVMAALIAAGQDGLRRDLQLPPANQTQDDGAKLLPKSLPEALAALEADQHMKSCLGEDFVRWYCATKRAEIARIEEDLSKMEGTESNISSVWQRLYMEFI